jgi:hypothetical protein
MKLKYVLYGFFGLSVLFAGAMGFLFFFQDSQAGRSRFGTLSDSPAEGVVIADRSRTASGRGGRAIIAYAGDIKGSLLPCG